jgi:hypothetical protein
VLLFAVLLSVATTLTFGLVPTLRASRIDLTQSLKAAGRGFFGGVSGRRSAQASSPFKSPFLSSC